VFYQFLNIKFWEETLTPSPLHSRNWDSSEGKSIVTTGWAIEELLFNSWEGQDIYITHS
jgi:hypothetical protein